MSRHVCTAAVCLFAAMAAVAHVGGQPSIHDTVATILERMRDTLTPEELTSLTAERVLAFMTEDERQVLGTQFLAFNIDQPATVHVAWNGPEDSRPFWLEARGFTALSAEARANGRKYEVWTRVFPAGRVELGYSNIDGRGEQYFTVVQGIEPGASVDISEVYPGQHRTTDVEEGARIYSDDFDWQLEEYPGAWEGGTIVRGLEGREDDTLLVNIWRKTDYPATDAPDFVTLTWSDDPKTTQTIQWRTSTAVEQGAVSFWPAAEDSAPIIVEAERMTQEDPYLANDPVVHRFTATLTGLQPDTDYRYQVGTGTDGPWCCTATFSTAPAEPEPFQFIYMGDAQNGLDTWGELVHKAYERQPEARFYVMAGDLVNRGNERDDWDSFFHNATGIYEQRQLIPAIGNHEDQGPGPWMYLENFTLPRNGPEEIPAERAYTVEYSNAIFIVLDTNLPPMRQADWLEEQLANTTATWKFVVHHHPAYSSAPRRDNPQVRRFWSTLYDKYHVDLVMQGHDHAYLRTQPMYAEEPVDSPAEGTIYVVSVSGTKYYEQADREYIAKGMTNTSTYQVLDITIDGDSLHYRAFDMAGELRDEFTIEK